MPTRPLRALFVALLLFVAVNASADKIDDLTRALMQDASYKVRVQAALVLGKLGDRRAVPALMQALHDENETVRGVAATSLGRIGDKSAANALMVASTSDSSEFVRSQAKKALEVIAGGGGGVLAAAPKAGAKFYVHIGFNSAGGKGGAEYSRLVREALFKELQKLPAVTLSVAGASGAPSKAILSSHHLQGYIVDGTIQRLSASPAGGQQQIDCDLKAFVATFPENSIKMMTQEGASLQTGSGASEEMSGKRDCLVAAIEAVRDDVGKFLRTQE
ncbi:MAG: lyase domain protein repeat-containing protein [Myxococcales bacterium]|nr:lyase domain protein repeat-containing protein [Myxococcales bacterium]